MPKKLEPAENRLNPIQINLLKAEVIESLKTVFDPELPVNIYDLGLIYDVSVSEEAHVHILMTLTSPACPVAESLPGEAQTAVEMTPGVKSAFVELTWDPPYSIDMMPEHVRLELGIFY